MAWKIKDYLIDGFTVALVYVLLQMAWTEIGKLLPIFAQVAGFGFQKIGLTVGLVLALAIGIPLADRLRKRIPLKFLK